MVKIGGGKKGKSKAMVGKGKRTAKPAPAGIKLDAEARRYAALLQDPCFAPLTPALYDGSGSGLFVRVESDVIIDSAATETCAACYFTPGILSSIANNSSLRKAGSALSNDLSSLGWTDEATKQPGYGFIGAFGATRVVSACLQASYVGAEQNRSGVMAFGQVSRKIADGFATPAAVRQEASLVARVPDGVMEIKLVPEQINGEWAPVNAAVAQLDSYPTLFFSASGLPVATGIRIRLVQVLEWQPVSAAGVISQPVQSNSINTVSQVLKALAKAKPHWNMELITGIGAYAAKAAVALL